MKVDPPLIDLNSTRQAQVTAVEASYMSGKLWSLCVIFAVSLGLKSIPAVAQATNPAGHDFETVALGQSATASVTFNFTGSVTVASVAVVTKGAAGRDFQATLPDASGTLCTARAYSSGQSCTVDITFSPLAPGKRLGAAVLRDSSNRILASGYVTGFGSGAQLGFTTPTVSTFVGTGTYSTTNPSGSSGTSAGFIDPIQVAFDGSGNMYMADFSAEMIYKITPAGLVSTLLGSYRTNCGTTYSCGYPTSDSTMLASAAKVNLPQSTVVDGAGLLWFVDNSNSGLATIDLTSGYVTAQVPGTGTTLGAPHTSGNIHSLGAASLGGLSTLATDGLGNIYVGAFYDGTQTTFYSMILKLDPAGNISVFAGNTTPSYGTSAPVDGTLATNAVVGEAWGMGFDGSGNFYYFDPVYHQVFKVDTAGKVHPFAGSGVTTSDNTSGLSYWQSGTASTTSNLSVNFATKVGMLAVDPNGDVFLPSAPSSYSNSNSSSRVFVFTPSGDAYVLAGTGPLGETNGPASSSELAQPTSVALDETGDVYISENYLRQSSATPAVYIGSTVRKWTMAASTLSFGSQAMGSTSTGQAVTATNIGNAQLVLTTPPSGKNPDPGASFTLLSNSAFNACGTGNSGAVAVGSDCSVIAAFEPHQSSGTVNGNLVYTGNLPGGTTSVPMTGTAAPGVASLKLTGLPTTATSGASNTVTVSALDGSQNPFTSYTGTVHFSLSPTDVAASLPSDYKFTSADGGTKQFTVALAAVGAQTLTVADTANGLSVNQGTTVVSAVDHLAFTVAPPTTTTAGTNFGVTVTAYSSMDSSQVATSYTGPVKFTSSDSNAVLPASGLTLTNGVGTFSITLKTVGTQTITVADSSGSPSVTSSSIVVSAAAASTLATVTGTPQSTAANTAFGTALEVQVLDAYSNPVASQTVSFTAPSSGASAVLSASSCTTDATGMCSVTATANQYGGTYKVSASLNALSVNFSLTNNAPLAYVVTVATDDAGVAANCVDQNSGSTASNANCSLRDALAAAAAVPSSATRPATITFAMTQPTTITLANGELRLPSYTTVQSAVQGSGPGHTNMVTVNGGGISTVFYVRGATVSAVLNNLIITNGAGLDIGIPGCRYGGGIDVDGALTVNGSAIQGNTACFGGGISVSGSLVLLDSTVAGNTATSVGGGIVNGSHLTIGRSTITGNSARVAGGVNSFPGATVWNTTISGNSATVEGGGWVESNLGSSSINNSVIAGNTAPASPDIELKLSGVLTGTGNVADLTGTNATAAHLSALGNYGGPTQTMLPLPGSPAICAGLQGDLGNGETTDQRGYPNMNTTYPSFTSGTPCVDAGAVQTNYSLAFVQQPTNAFTNAALSPSPTVQLKENGTATTVSGLSLTVSAAAGTLSGTTSESTDASGLATFGGLSIATTESADTLTVSTPLTSGTPPAVNLTATSDSFDVSPPVTSFTITATPTTQVAGQSFGYTVTAYNGAAVSSTYTGQVSFATSDSRGGFISSSYTFTSADNGVHTFTGNAYLRTVGSQTITVTDASANVSATSSSITVTPGTPARVTAVSGDLQSATIGAAFAARLVVKVTDFWGNAISGVTVNYTAPTSGASAALSSSGTGATGADGTLSLTATANATAGSYVISATSPVIRTAISSAAIAARPEYAVSSSVSFHLTNTQATPTIALTASPVSPIAYGQSATTLNATATYTTGTATGSIRFLNGTSSLGSAEMSAGAATLPARYFVPGTYSFEASYDGDSNYVAANSSASTYVVNKASSSLSGPAAQPVFVVYNQSGSVPVTIAGQYSGTGIETPSGSISYTISSGSTTVVSATTAAIAGGAATIPIASTMSPGLYSVTVTYGGDANYNAASSTTIPLQVGQIQPTIHWTPPTSSITYGATLSGLLDATAMDGSSTVAGTYSYSAGSSAITASKVLGAGSYTLTVSFAPTDTTTYKSATGSIALTVLQATPAVSLASSVNPVLVSNATELTATISSSAGVPTGTVQFLDGATPIGSTAVSGGVATLSVSSLAIGSHSLSAVYSGDANFATSSSSALTEKVDDFNLTISTTTSSGSSTSQTVVPGGQATYQFTLSPTGTSTFSALVNLTVSGLPAGATYVITPTSIAAGSGPTDVTLVVTVPSESAAAVPTGSFPPGAAPLLALLLLPFSRRFRQRARRLGSLALALFVVLGLGAALLGTTGCGARTGFFAQGQQTYNLTVTGTSGALSHSTSVTLTVE